jgi:hypothetical protein
MQNQYCSPDLSFRSGAITGANISLHGPVTRNSFTPPGPAISAVFITMVNAWMNTPTGFDATVLSSLLLPFSDQQVRNSFVFSERSS